MRHSPLDGVLPWGLPDGAVSLSELRFARQIGLRLRPPMPAYIGGVPLPLQPNRVAVMRAGRILLPLPRPRRRAAAGPVVQIECIELVLARRRNRQIGVAPAVRVAGGLVPDVCPLPIPRPLAPQLAHRLEGVTRVEAQRA